MIKDDIEQKYTKGICCECQSAHQVVFSDNANDGYFDGNELKNYLIAPHKMFGHWCKGDFTVPQALVE